MASFNTAISVQGFAQLSRALRALGDGADKELRRRLKEIGDVVGLVAAGDAPRITGELQHSIKSSAVTRGASVYSTAVYGGAINYGAWTKRGRGPHIRRASASHYMDKAVTQTQPFVEHEAEALLDWAMTTFEGR
jgi:hypothetical protein